MDRERGRLMMGDVAGARAGLLERARQGFGEAFGSAPSHGAWAPGRVNLIGEHTDYNAGLALPIAIDRGCVTLVRANGGARDRLVALDIGRRVGFEADEPETPAWSRYLSGVIALMRERLAGPDAVDVAIASSVPIGAGLSSSAAVEVSVATAWEAIAGRTLDRIEKARLCQRAEHESAGVPCGLMDQLTGVAAEEGHAMRIDFRGDTWTQVPAPPTGSLLVVDTGVRHALADGEYAARREACETAAERLGLESLREASPASADDRRLDFEQRRCVRHVTGEIERVKLASTALKRGELAELGKLMIESHASLRDDYRVSCEELDRIVDAVVSMDGVYGARMTGAGFGGSAIVLGEPEVISALAQREIGGERGRFLVSASGGASVIDVG